MKKFLIIILLVLLAGVAYYSFTNNAEEENLSSDQDVTTETEDYSEILGCYEAGRDRDVYTMTIENVSEAGEVSGNLEFDNYQTDSSEGPFEGSYDGEHLYGLYTFSSEGMESVMEVAFERQGEDFVRGFGEVSDDGTMFVDRETISYESSELSLFEKVDCTEEDL